MNDWFLMDHPTAKRDADVLWLRRRGWKQKEIGERLGLSQGRISQLEVRALRRERIAQSQLIQWIGDTLEVAPVIIAQPDAGWSMVQRDAVLKALSTLFDASRHLLPEAETLSDDQQEHAMEAFIEAHDRALGLLNVARFWSAKCE